jgi:hypothetical protein
MRFSFLVPMFLLASTALVGCAGSEAARPAAAPITSAEETTKNACDQDKFWERDPEHYEACHDGSTSAQLPAETREKAKAEHKASASTSTTSCGRMCRFSGESRAATRSEQRRAETAKGR